MNVDNPGSHDAPPKGLVAHILAASKELESGTIPNPAAREPPQDAAQPPNSSLDPNYVEPPALADIRKDLESGAVPALAIATLLLARAEVLEKVMLPFCMHGLIMSNAKMCLLAMGRNDPAGGVWFSQPNNIRMQPNEKIFYDVIDAVGRARSERYATDVFEKMNAVKDAAAEHAKHIEAGGQTH